MTDKSRYIEKPAEVLCFRNGDSVTVSLALNAEQKTDYNPNGSIVTYWEADTTQFTRPVHSLDLDDVRRNPEKYLAWRNNDPARYKQYQDAIQAMLDDAARAMQYDDVMSAVSYAGSSVARFHAEGCAFRDWRAAVWDKAIEMFNLMLTGEVEIPATPAHFVAQLPQLSEFLRCD